MSRAADFWSQALGCSVRGGRVSQDSSAVLVPSPGQGPAITLDENDRMHLDLYVESGDELATEVGRLVDLGAERVTWPYPDDAHFVVLADTEGNLFCVVDVGDRSRRDAGYNGPTASVAPVLPPGP